jgi:hypothetical protein
MEGYVITQPEDPPENVSCTKIRLWEMIIDDHVNGKNNTSRK